MPRGRGRGGGRWEGKIVRRRKVRRGMERRSRARKVVDRDSVGAIVGNAIVAADREEASSMKWIWMRSYSSWVASGYHSLLSTRRNWGAKNACIILGSVCWNDIVSIADYSCGWRMKFTRSKSNCSVRYVVYSMTLDYGKSAVRNNNTLQKI